MVWGARHVWESLVVCLCVGDWYVKGGLPEQQEQMKRMSSMSAQVHGLTGLRHLTMSCWDGAVLPVANHPNTRSHPTACSYKLTCRLLAAASAQMPAHVLWLKLPG
jgi:hypothetical protein